MLAPRVLTIVALFLLVGGCSGASDTSALSTSFTATAPAAAPADGSGTAVSQGYRLSTGDTLDISVFQVPDLTKEVQIDAAGDISLPLIGQVKAGGLTTHGLETEIAAKLQAKYLQSPQVSIFLKNAAGQQVTVDGSVKTPGVHPIVGQMTLVQAVAESGGIDDVGDTSAVLVFRPTNGRRTVAKFNLDDIRSGKAPDPNLYAGDMVIVDSSGSRSLWKNVSSAIPTFATFAYVAPLL